MTFLAFVLFLCSLCTIESYHNNAVNSLIAYSRGQYRYKSHQIASTSRRAQSLTAASKSKASNSVSNVAKPVTVPPKPSFDRRLQYGLGKIAFSLLPLSPEAVGRRKSLLTEIVPDIMWTIDQVQGIINVNVPVRCTIIRLQKDNSIFINNPVAPTQECLDMVRSIASRYNATVKHIVLSSLALEHKGTTGAFSSYFPQSTVYLQPGQYAFPLDLPSWLFFPLGKQLKMIPERSEDAPWADEIDHAVLPTLKPKGPGGYAETAFFHKPTKTVRRQYSKLHGLVF